MLSIKYHDIFNYPLDSKQLEKWRVGKKLQNINTKFKVENKNGFYFIKGRKNIIRTRLENEKYSKEKLKIARKASNILSKIPTIKFIGITGSLAMNNASKNSDIDLMIITKKNTLWTSRLLVYLSVWLFGIQRRIPQDKNQKDKLCFNMWLDESDLVWDETDRNLYTAHEISQIVPLVNKDETYERLLAENKWILDFWPLAVEIKTHEFKIKHSNSKTGIIERLSFWIQKKHMQPRITREVVTRNRALFHPQDWGKVVLQRLAS